MEDISIQLASLKNTDELAKLFDLYRQFYKQPSNLAHAKNFLVERVLLKDSFIFCAFDRTKKMVGFVQLYPTFSSLAMKPLLLLNDLYVTDTHRKQEVAR